MVNRFMTLHCRKRGWNIKLKEVINYYALPSKSLSSCTKPPLYFFAALPAFEGAVSNVLLLSCRAWQRSEIKQPSPSSSSLSLGSRLKPRLPSRREKMTVRTRQQSAWKQREEETGGRMDEMKAKEGGGATG